jgi:hypothetical protein
MLLFIKQQLLTSSQRKTLNSKRSYRQEALICLKENRFKYFWIKIILHRKGHKSLRHLINLAEHQILSLNYLISILIMSL